ncbi:MAG: DUF1786 domain-containing protein [Methanosarcinaceae archaeon]|jgi:uncharacterized protein (DUF1786 family)|nr:DUF1786 domain-containing protein [Methanosarcinaceae archaeon]NKQ38363.1 DUF1786 domain-containing protein [Methanosarcinales archaeon]
MKILCMDIGTGTVDMLFANTINEIENNSVLILPSPTRIIAKKIEKATYRGKSIVLTGYTMGGGPSTRAVKVHLKKGLKVYATKNAALTINDDFEKLSLMGVKLIDENELKSLPNSVCEIIMQDVDLDAIETALSVFGEELPSHFAVAVQDHGFSPKESNRVFRFNHFENIIDKGGDISSFTYTHETIPLYMTRIKALSDILKNKKAIFMDTGPAAIFGALLDVNATQPAIVVNIGNGHTIGALVIDFKIVALFEHHTGKITEKKIQDYIIRLADGDLNFKEVFEDRGHGCYIKEYVGFENVKSVIITGPKRGILQNMKLEYMDFNLSKKIVFAAPFGNMMLTGSFGLLKAYLTQENKNTNRLDVFYNSIKNDVCVSI